MTIDRQGQEPDSYQGVNPVNRPKTVIAQRAPGALDRRYNIGTPWINRQAGSVYFLTTVAGGAANWAISTPGASDVDTLTGDSGGALSPTGGNINILGGTNVTVAGSGSTLTANLDANPTLAGLLTCNASATINTGGTAFNLGSDNSGDAVILGGGTLARAITIGQDAAAHTVAIGQVAAGAITVDTAAGVSVDSATASNFTVADAGEDLTLESTLGRVIVNAEEAAANAITLLSAAGGIDMDAAQAVAVDGSEGISLDAAKVSNFTVADAGENLNLGSTLGSVLVSSGEDAALAIRLHADGGTSETIQIHSDQGTGVASIDLLSDVGGISAVATGLASADAINLTATAGGVDIDGALEVNIASSQAAETAVNIVASNGAGGVTMAVGTGNVNVSGGDLVLSSVGTQLQMNGGAQTDFIGQATLVSGTLTILNTNIAITDRIFLSRADENSSTALGMLTVTALTNATSWVITSLAPVDGSTTVTGDVSIVNYFIVRQN